MSKPAVESGKFRVVGLPTPAKAAGQMKTSIFALALGLMLPHAAFGYTFDLFGKAAGSSYTFDPSSYTTVGGHGWDRFSLNWSPGQGESVGLLEGNVQTGSGSPVRVRSSAGEDPAGIVTISLSYVLQQELHATYNNYLAADPDAHGEFVLGIYRGFSRSAPNQIASYALSFGSSNIVFELQAGDQFALFYGAYTSVPAVRTGGNWHPTVIDPSIPGVATVEVDATFFPTSIQIVPEPGSLSLCALGLFLMRSQFSSKHRKSLIP